MGRKAKHLIMVLSLALVAGLSITQNVFTSSPSAGTLKNKLQPGPGKAIDLTRTDIALAVAPGPAAAEDVVKVGATNDACDGDERVTFTAKDGPASVKAGVSETKDLATTTREINWKCGDSKERSANDEPFNRVKITRAGNGAIHWVFFHVTGGGGTDTVGDTEDACDRDNVVKLAGRDGTETVAAGKTKNIDLPSATREINWYCGGTRERVANNDPFNRVRVNRADNGAITWTFLMVPEGRNQGGPGMVRVGESFDACDKSESVNMRDDKIKVKAGEIHTIPFDPPVRSFRFFCGKSKERATNPNLFNIVQVERAGNGAIHWVFYRQTQITGDNLGDFVHNAAGDVLAGWHKGGKPPDVIAPVQAGFLKTALDQVWNDERPGIAEQFGEEIRQDDKIKLDKLTLSTADRGELRVGRRTAGVTLKYVVHQNTAAVSWLRGDPEADINVILTFDLEIVLVLPRNQSSKSLQVTSATGFARHVEMTGGDPWGNFMVELARTLVHRKETALGTKSRDITEKINARLKDVRETMLSQFGGSIPPGFDNLAVDSSPNGTLLVCLNKRKGLSAQAQRAQHCPFASSPEPNTDRIVSDTSHDSCSQSRVWLWDHEKGKFVNVPRGGSGVIVEMDNRRLEWFCGGPAAPDTDNDEWATGPDRTYGVRVTRPAGKDRIDWEFLDWRPKN